MELITNTPYLIRVLISLLFILIMNKISRQLAVSIVFGILALAFWSGHPVGGIGAIAWKTFSSTNNLCLILVIVQVICLASQMSWTGVMKDLVETINSLVSQRTSIALLPAVIGLIPMPGGAIFSAPLVDECDHDKSIDPIIKAKINYWFRHVWEYWWPLYPGVLLAVEITKIPVHWFMLLMFPLCLFSILGGYLFILKKINNENDSKKIRKKSDIKKLLLLLVPIIIIILIYSVIKIFIPFISEISRYLPMIIGIFISQIFLQIKKPMIFIDWRNIIFSFKTLNFILIVILVLIYGAFINARLPDGTMLMTYMRSELALLGIPLIAVIIIIPFICGLTTGIAIGFIGASFPIVLSLIGNNPTTGQLLSTTILAFGSGYVGMILSPVHICLIVTNEHFKTSLVESLLKLIRPALVVFLGTIVMYFIIVFAAN